MFPENLVQACFQQVTSVALLLSCPCDSTTHWDFIFPNDTRNEMTPSKLDSKKYPCEGCHEMHTIIDRVLFSGMIFSSHREKQESANMLYFIYLYFGEPCSICKELGLPADAMPWTEELSISSFPSLSWWPSVSNSHRVDQPTQNLGLFLHIRCPLLELLSKAMGVLDFFFFLMNVYHCLWATKNPFSVYLGSLRQLSRSQTAVFIYINYMDRDLYIDQQKWQLRCYPVAPTRNRTTSI